MIYKLSLLYNKFNDIKMFHRLILQVGKLRLIVCDRNNTQNTCETYANEECDLLLLK